MSDATSKSYHHNNQMHYRAGKSDTAGALEPWLKLPAWEVVDRRFETRSGI